MLSAAAIFFNPSCFGSQEISTAAKSAIRSGISGRLSNSSATSLGVVLAANREEHPLGLERFQAVVEIEEGLPLGVPGADLDAGRALLPHHAPPEGVVEVEHQALARLRPRRPGVPDELRRHAAEEGRAPLHLRQVVHAAVEHAVLAEAGGQAIEIEDLDPRMPLEAAQQVEVQIEEELGLAVLGVEVRHAEGGLGGHREVGDEQRGRSPLQRREGPGLDVRGDVLLEIAALGRRQRGEGGPGLRAAAGGATGRAARDRVKRRRGRCSRPAPPARTGRSRPRSARRATPRGRSGGPPSAAADRG